MAVNPPGPSAPPSTSTEQSVATEAFNQAGKIHFTCAAAAYAHAEGRGAHMGSVFLGGIRLDILRRSCGAAHPCGPRVTSLTQSAIAGVSANTESSSFFSFHFSFFIFLFSFLHFSDLAKYLVRTSASIQKVLRALPLGFCWLEQVTNQMLFQQNMLPLNLP